MSETPTMQLTKPKVVTVTDSLGRTIQLRKPGILAQYRLIEVLGPSADIDRYMNMVMPLQYVCAIDDDNTIVMGKKSEVEALIQRLGEEGIEAVMNGVKEHFGGDADPNKDKDDIKK